MNSVDETLCDMFLCFGVSEWVSWKRIQDGEGVKTSVSSLPKALQLSGRNASYPYGSIQR